MPVKVQTMAPCPLRVGDTGSVPVRASPISHLGSPGLQIAIAAGTAQSEETAPCFDSRLSDIIGEILYGIPLQLTCNKMQQNDYSVAFGQLVALKVKTLQAAIMASSAL